jgi:methylmalonyl-CoA/ethylmalonyl-CoA epimerase
MSLRLHHVGVLVKDIPSAARNFVTTLGCVIESEVIEDPVQTACVQFLRQPGTAFWLELVTPNGPNSKLTNALKKGGGPHHFCYETDDINGTCGRLREQRMLILGGPVKARAFPHRRIAWLMDRSRMLIELLESGEGPLSLASLSADLH